MTEQPADPRPPGRRAGPGPLHELSHRDLRRGVVRSVLRAIAASAAILVAYAVLPLRATSAVHVAVLVVVGGATIVAVLAWQMLAVSRSAAPMRRAAEALAIGVTVMTVVFAVVYLNLSHDDAAAFSERLDKVGALYFTLTTATTVGFGDIAARSNPARIAVMVQFVFNVAVIGGALRLTLSVARHRAEMT